jgi:hypothetical protein
VFDPDQLHLTLSASLSEAFTFNTPSKSSRFTLRGLNSIRYVMSVTHHTENTLQNLGQEERFGQVVAIAYDVFETMADPSVASHDL